MAVNRLYRRTNRSLQLDCPAGAVSGDPVIRGQIPGVLLTARDTRGVGTVALDGVFNLNVQGVDQSGNSAVVPGDRIYYTQADAVKLSKKNTGVPFGFALEAVASGNAGTVIPVEVQGF